MTKFNMEDDDYKTKIKDFVADLDDNYLLETMMFMIESMNDRLTWDQYFSLIACVAKQRSSCERLKVGCVIVKDNRILATGYNGHIAGAPHISKIEDGHEQMTIHAETNAVCSAAKTGVNLENSKIYVTHFPCPNCAKVILSAGINEIYYLNDYKNSDISYELFRSKGVKVIKLHFSLVNELKNK
uniref:CMP/dCMP-type deaminase domain-containing protein n=1 Tax=viral metagenome TaxID=1070528 RepID=A0A6C0AC93_9ZZZZ